MCCWIHFFSPTSSRLCRCLRYDVLAEAFPAGLAWLDDVGCSDRRRLLLRSSAGLRPVWYPGERGRRRVRCSSRARARSPATQLCGRRHSPLGLLTLSSTTSCARQRHTDGAYRPLNQRCGDLRALRAIEHRVLEAPSCRLSLHAVRARLPRRYSSPATAEARLRSQSRARRP